MNQLILGAIIELLLELGYQIDEQTINRLMAYPDISWEAELDTTSGCKCRLRLNGSDVTLAIQYGPYDISHQTIDLCDPNGTDLLRDKLVALTRPSPLPIR